MFYNAAMALDRDLHVAVTSALAAERGGFRSGWEMLAASGVRGLRVLEESSALGRLVSTEVAPAAHAVLAENAARYAAHGATARRWDARDSLSGETFDWVDVDPFGSPLPFLGAALRSIEDGGLLSVSATDMLVLAGVQRGAAERLYGSSPVRGRLGPEGGLRILLKAISERADALGRSIRPRLAYVHDHYVRAYVTVAAGRGRGEDVGTIETATWQGPPLLGGAEIGPLWLGPLLDPPLLSRVAVPETASRAGELAALYARWREESSVDVPFYYESNSLAHEAGLPAPPPVGWLVDRLVGSGHRAARSAARPGAFRTDAPRGALYALARDWPGSGTPTPRPAPEVPPSPSSGIR